MLVRRHHYIGRARNYILYKFLHLICVGESLCYSYTVRPCDKFNHILQGWLTVTLSIVHYDNNSNVISTDMGRKGLYQNITNTTLCESYA